LIKIKKNYSTKHKKSIGFIIHYFLGTAVPAALYLASMFITGAAQELIAIIGAVLTLYGTYRFRLMLLNMGYHEPLVSEKIISAKGLLD